MPTLVEGVQSKTSPNPKELVGLAGISLVKPVHDVLPIG
jgi:hypothetical protein